MFFWEKHLHCYFVNTLLHKFAFGRILVINEINFCLKLKSIHIQHLGHGFWVFLKGKNVKSSTNLIFQ